MYRLMMQLKKISNILLDIFIQEYDSFVIEYNGYSNSVPFEILNHRFDRLDESFIYENNKYLYPMLYNGSTLFLYGIKSKIIKK